MPELRLDRFTNEWVPVATECPKHLKDLFVKPVAKRLPAFDPICPFCPGNEDRTAAEVLRVTTPAHSGWTLRVVQNKVATPMSGMQPPWAVTCSGSVGEGFCTREVIVETPDHSLSLALLPDAHLASLLHVAKARYRELCQDAHVEYVTLLKHHSVERGEHSHSRLIATPMVPSDVHRRLRAAFRDYQRTGKCLFCTVLQKELDEETRIVIPGDHFVALEPYASETPFLTLIHPRRHTADFRDIKSDEISDLARTLRRVLAKLYLGLENPDYDYTIRTAPVALAEVKYYHWCLSIAPRLIPVADVEADRSINMVPPEAAAEFLRAVRVELAATA